MRRRHFRNSLARWGAAAFANHHAGLHVERREQCRRAVALVIVGHRGGAALPERQSRPGPVQGACIRDFSSRQSTTGRLRRIEAKPDDVGDFLLQQWIVRHLEPACQMRLQTGLRPDPTHARR